MTDFFLPDLLLLAWKADIPEADLLVQTLDASYVTPIPRRSAKWKDLMPQL